MRAQGFFAAVLLAALTRVVSGQDDPPPTDPVDPVDPVDPENPEDPGETPDFCVELPFLCQTPEPPAPPSFQIFNDERTGFKYGQWDVLTLEEERLYYRIAIPDTARAGTPYDVVVQMEAPNTMSWIAIAWGGVMMHNPLTVAWPNCSNVVISSRWASDRVLPTAYAGSTLDILDTGTFVNETHWQVTIHCKGCTSWVGEDDRPKFVNPESKGYTFGWAFGKIPVDESRDPNTTFIVHDATGTWEHDLTESKNADFGAMLEKNRKAPAPAEPPAPQSTCAFTWIPPPGAIIVTTKLTVSSCPAATATVAPLVAAEAPVYAEAAETVYVTMPAATSTVYVAI